jgi:hypothetical protein
MQKYCHAYAEVKNLETGVVYRLDTEDYKRDSSIYDENDRIIIPYEPSIIFEKNEDRIDNPSHVINASTGEFSRSFGNFVVYSSINTEHMDPDSDLTPHTESDFVQGFYYIDKNGLSIPENMTDEDIEGKILGVWRDTLIKEDLPVPVSNTLYIKFKNLTKFTIAIDFKKYMNKDGENVFPKSVVYIGFPNINLIQEGTDGKVYLPNSYHDKKKKESSEKNPPEVYNECDGDPGIYYLYKFIPFGYRLNEENDNSTIADAGSAAVNIDIAKFKLDPNVYNFIEVGVIPFGNMSNDEHRAAILLAEESEGDPRLAEASLENKFFTFDAPTTVIDNYIELSTTSNLECPGKRDVAIYISSAEEYIAKELEGETTSATESLENEEDYIDYVNLGILYDSQNYKTELS